MELFRRYPWPGNVRELQNAVEHALVLCDSAVPGVKNLPHEIQSPELTTASTAVTHAPQTLVDVEKQTLIDAIRRANGNKMHAAAYPGIHRPTLYAKMKRFGSAIDQEDALAVFAKQRSVFDGSPDGKLERRARGGWLSGAGHPDPITPTSWHMPQIAMKLMADTNGATAGQKYWYRVAAFNGNGQGPWSPVTERPVM